MFTTTRVASDTKQTNEACNEGTLRVGNKKYRFVCNCLGNDKFQKKLEKAILVASGMSPRVIHKKAMQPTHIGANKTSQPSLKREKFEGKCEVKEPSIVTTMNLGKKHLNPVMRLADLHSQRHAGSYAQRPASEYVQEAHGKVTMNTELQARTLLKDVEKMQAQLDSNPQHVKAADIDRVLSNFMGLMSRIVDQIGGEGEELYREIDNTTNQMEFLTDFRTKISVATAPLDLAGKDAALKADIEKAVLLGVKIDPTKMTYDADEKKVLGEAISAKRENMANISQKQRMKIQQSTQKTTETYTMWSSMMKSLHSAIMRVLEHLVTGR